MMMIMTRAMKAGLKIVTGMFFSFSLISCAQEKVYLDEDDLAAINIYDIGDELVFKNVGTGETDTSTITAKEIYHEDYDWYRHDGYQPQIAQVRYRNEKLVYDENRESGLIAREKRKTNEELEFTITYLYSLFTSRDKQEALNKVALNSIDKTFIDVTVFSKKRNPRHKPKDDFKPQTLYWDKEYGIIKYETYGGEVWERINW
jgi:hypothetical protein